MGNQAIQWQLIIQGIKEATKDVETLKKTLRNVQDLKEKTLQSGDMASFQKLTQAENQLHKIRLFHEADLMQQRSNNNLALERQQLRISERIKQAQGQSYYNSVFNSSAYEEYHKRHLPAIQKGVKSLGLEFENTAKKADYLGSFGQKFRKVLAA